MLVRMNLSFCTDDTKMMFLNMRRWILLLKISSWCVQEVPNLWKTRHHKKDGFLCSRCLRNGNIRKQLPMVLKCKWKVTKNQSWFRDFQFDTNPKTAKLTLLQSAKKSEKELIQDEILTLRTAIYSLRQRKNLSASDQRLLHEMSTKLLTLTKKSSDLAKAELEMIQNKQ